MIEWIWDFLFGNPFAGEVTVAIAPLALAAAGVGTSLLGGFLADRFGRQRVPDELNALIGDLENPNFFLPFIQRAFGPQEETSFNINAQLAARGIDSPLIAEEQRQAATAQRGERVAQAVSGLEGQRLGMLQQALGQRIGIDARNARNRASAINSATAGVGGSLIQGLGAQQAAGIQPQGVRQFSPVGLQNMNPNNILPVPQLQLGTQSFSGSPNQFSSPVGLSQTLDRRFQGNGFGQEFSFFNRAFGSN